MPAESIPDNRCVPYPRKSWYLFLTIPFDLILIAITIYLWQFSPFLTLGMVFLFGMTSYFQAYCCAHQDCPYVGGFCPAVIGIMPASWIAKKLYSARPLVKSQAQLSRSFFFAMTSWIGLILLPLVWLAKSGIGFALGYIAAHALYSIIFGLTVCPVCAIRKTCPGGKFHQMFWCT